MKHIITATDDNKPIILNCALLADYRVTVNRGNGTAYLIARRFYPPDPGAPTRDDFSLDVKEQIVHLYEFTSEDQAWRAFGKLTSFLRSRRRVLNMNRPTWRQ